jgi:hypothetical protein
VNPELIQGVEGSHRKKHDGIEPYECNRKVEDPAKPALKPGLSQRHGKIVFLRLMMDDMCCPQSIDLMAFSVEPIVEKVNNEKQQYPYPDGIGQGIKAPMFIDIQITEKQSSLHENTDDLLANTLTEISEGIVEPEISKFFGIGIGKLNSNQDKEDGY